MKNLYFLTAIMSVMTIAMVSACGSGKQKSADTEQTITEPVIPEMTVTNVYVNGFAPNIGNPNDNLIEGTTDDGKTVETASDIKEWFDGTYSSVTMPEGQALSVIVHTKDMSVHAGLQEGSHLLYKVIFDDKTCEVKLEPGMKLKYVLSPEGRAKIIYDTAYCKVIE
ncbi:MAG: hypothetical protein LBK94_01760 [Prevotellaceae bacterium]|jgi:hypothetical protein|nr:hypothetical protein [Prevotellaceae bacterium]